MEVGFLIKVNSLSDIFNSSSHISPIPVFGFGVQRLTGLKSDEIATVEKKRLVNSVKSETTCAGVSNMRYTAAVIDNFVPVEDQQFWEGAGQRYWVNEELWGMLIY